MKRDPQATERARFEHSKSYVAWDGREILFGMDWDARKRELWARCKGRCEYKYRLGRLTVRCSAEAIDPHHLIKRSEERDDRMKNLLATCAAHHRLQHPEKQVRLKWLKSNS